MNSRILVRDIVVEENGIVGRPFHKNLEYKGRLRMIVGIPKIERESDRGAVIYIARSSYAGDGINFRSNIEIGRQNGGIIPEIGINYRSFIIRHFYSQIEFTVR